MNFRLFQKHHRKILLWSGATTLFITLVSLIIVLAIPLTSNQVKLMVTVQTIVNGLLIWLFLWWGNQSRFFIRSLVQVNVYRHKKQIQAITLSLRKWVYLYLFLFLALLWLIETTGFAIWTKSWPKAFTDYWWITFIFFGINYLYLTVFWSCQIYLYNHDTRILSSLHEPQHRS